MSELTVEAPPQYDQLATALAALQAEMPTVAKSHTATVRSDKGNYSYTYAGLADVSEAVMPLMAKHGLSFTALPGHGVLTGMLLHSSGQSLTASLPITGGTPQAIGSSLTYMRRYLLGCMTGLVTDDDDDGQTAARAPRKPKKQADPAPAQWSDEPPDLRVPGDRSESPHLDTTGPLAKAMFAALGDIGKKDKGDRLAYVSKVIGREITGSAEMTDADAHAVLKQAKADLEQPFPGDAA